MSSPPPSSPSPSNAPTTPTQLIEVIPNRIDITEEAQLYDDILCDDDDGDIELPVRRSVSPELTPSIFSFGESIWLQDNSGVESMAFAQDVEISGWTSVGEQLGGGAYIVYDCCIKTKEGTVIHAHKRYTSFVQLDHALRRTLPRHLHPAIPALPPKAPLQRYRSAFLERRRQLLQHWLSSVLLHPEIGASKAARLWVME